MSRREDLKRATISALQPRSPRLHQLRQTATRDSIPVLAPEEAAGALAYAALDAGTDIRPRLLRLKVDPMDRAGFEAVVSQLLEQHGFRAARPNPMLYAVVHVALFEWLHDACPKCRVRRAGEPAAKPGMVCRTCQNTGRLAFNVKARRALAADLWRSIVRGQPFPNEIWRRVWIARHHEILVDIRRLGGSSLVGVDLRETTSENALTVPDPHDSAVDMEKDEPVKQDTGLAPT